MTSRREAAIGLVLARAMAEQPMIQGPNGEMLNSMEELEAMGALEETEPDIMPERELEDGSD